MDEQSIDEAGEIVGAAKELFKAFESRLAEVMASQRLASNETNEAVAETRRTLMGLLQHARDISDMACAAQEDLRRGWQLHVAENSKAAGSDMARKFGEEISKGLEQRLAQLAGQVEDATRRLTWKNNLRWAVGLAIAIPLTITLGIQTFMPTVDQMSIPGLSVAQTRDVISRIRLCWPQRNDFRDEHVCVMTDDPPRFVHTPRGEPAAVAQGM